MKIVTYSQARKYLEDLIKPYQSQRIEGVPEEFNNPLGRMKYLLNLLDNPQKKFPSVVVSGTSGKSSTTYYIAHMLSTAGYKTGMTISPHLQKLNERMQINNIEIPDERLVEILSEMVPAIEEMKQSPLGAPSYFEALLALSFYYFAKEKVDIVVAEVGLEGKFDGTNVLDRLIFLYTNTSLDHTQILGETVEEIAQEGVAGIQKHPKKHTAPVVISGVTQPSVVGIFEKACKEAGVGLFLLDRDFSYHLIKSTEKKDEFSFSSGAYQLNNIVISMTGSYQALNAALAIETIKKLGQFGFIVSDEKIKQALGNAFFPGRFEMIADNIILDGAHNPAKMEAFISSLQKIYPHKKKILVLGFKEGKNIDAMLSIVLPIADIIVTTEFHVVMDWTKNPSVKGGGLFEEVTNHPALVKDTPVFPTMTTKEALTKAEELQKEHPDSLIVVTGSLYLVGETRQLLTAEK